MQTKKVNENSHKLLTNLASCQRCPRLVGHRQDVLAKYPDYMAHPIGAWGSSRHHLLIVGLAPGLHGAARTGKAFVGDASGNFLFTCLHKAGYATSPNPLKAKLVNTQITNVVKCLPPGNLPTTEERNQCGDYLDAELRQFMPVKLRKPRVILVLGGFAFRATIRALNIKGLGYTHHLSHALTDRVQLVVSHHPSQLNVNTGRLTQGMFDAVLDTVTAHLER